MESFPQAKSCLASSSTFLPTNQQDLPQILSAALAPSHSVFLCSNVSHPASSKSPAHSLTACSLPTSLFHSFFSALSVYAQLTMVSSPESLPSLPSSSLTKMNAVLLIRKIIFSFIIRQIISIFFKKMFQFS